MQGKVRKGKLKIYTFNQYLKISEKYLFVEVSCSSAVFFNPFFQSRKLLRKKKFRVTPVQTESHKLRFVSLWHFKSQVHICGEL